MVLAPPRVPGDDGQAAILRTPTTVIEPASTTGGRHPSGLPERAGRTRHSVEGDRSEERRPTGL
jgi:hypothetical protein